uniref:Uncharacterized protein n=1 Tax=Fagus sylvatica TaxID=28930 RepID=A0A2N9J0V0_FAGSY
MSTSKSILCCTGPLIGTSRRDVAVYSSAPGPSIPSNPSNPGQWKVWIVGVIASVILPFFGIKFGPLLKIKKEVDTMVQTAEDVVEAVEKVAEEVDKVAEEIKERLPAGGKLRVAVTYIENVAERTAKDARNGRRYH